MTKKCFFFLTLIPFLAGGFFCSKSRPREWTIDLSKMDAAQLAFDPNIRLVPHIRDEANIGFRLLSVNQESAYALAGFRKGDILLELNGFSCAKFSMKCNIAGLFAKPGPFSYKIERGGEVIQNTGQIIGR